MRAREEIDQVAELGDRPPEPIALGWLYLAVLLLSAIFGLVAVLLVGSLSLAGVSISGSSGVLVAVFMLPMTAPRTLKQLAVVAVIVLAGGVLAVVASLAVSTFDWGFWGRVAGMSLSLLSGAGFVLLCYRLFKVEIRVPRNGS